METKTRINVGCGQSPTPGWRNFDNSVSLRVARVPFLPKLLYLCRMIEQRQYEFMEFARSSQIEYGDAAKGLPLVSGSVDVVYSSHMLEHLDRSEVSWFLKEVRRVLCRGGIIRLALPDLRLQVDQYLKSEDSDTFIAGTHLCQPRPRTVLQRLRLLLVGTRHHQWMYDGKSLCRLLEAHGFINADIVPAGETRIPNPGALDLEESAAVSVYVEAENP